jgi:hypothetical protein
MIVEDVFSQIAEVAMAGAEQRERVRERDPITLDNS